MAVIRQIAFGDGTVVRITDWGDYPIWSRIVYNATNITTIGQDNYLFQYKVGGQLPVPNILATYADTNMPGAGHLPLGHQMLVYSLQVIPDEHGDSSDVTQITPEDFVGWAFWKWRKIFHQALLKLTVEQTKSYIEGRLDHFPAGGGIQFQHTLPTSAQEAYTIENGVAGWHATRRLAMPVHLGSLENFNVIISWPRNGLDYDQTNYAFAKGFGLTVRLTGPRQRPTA